MKTPDSTTAHAHASTETSTKKKNKKSKKDKLAKKNLKETSKEVKGEKGKKEEKKPERQLMYIYAEGMTQEEKKSFRRQTRAAIKRHQKVIDRLSEKDSLNKEEKKELRSAQEELGKIIGENRNPKFKTSK